MPRTVYYASSDVIAKRWQACTSQRVGNVLHSGIPMHMSCMIQGRYVMIPKKYTFAVSGSDTAHHARSPLNA
jgi:hypothetical protein